MANQGYLGRKTHPARATDKARALFFAPSPSLTFALLLCVCRSVCPSAFYCLCSAVGKLLSQGDTKVQRAWLPHYGIKAVSSANTHEKNSKAHMRVCVCVCGCYVCSVTDVCYRLKTCVTDNQARTGGGRHGNSEWEWAINAWAAHQLISCPAQPCCLVS